MSNLRPPRFSASSFIACPLSWISLSKRYFRGTTSLEPQIPKGVRPAIVTASECDVDILQRGSCGKLNQYTFRVGLHLCERLGVDRGIFWRARQEKDDR